MAASLTASLLVAMPAQAAPAKPPKVQAQKYVSGKSRAPRAPKQPPADQLRPKPTPATSWPKAGIAEIDAATARTKAVRAGRLPVWVRPARTGPKATAGSAKTSAGKAPGKVRVEVLDGRLSQRAKLRGIMLRVAPSGAAAGKATAARAGIEIDYSGFRYAYGGDYASRLRLVRLPACVTTTPDRKECQAATPVPTRNDVPKSRASADIDLGMARPTAGRAAATATSGTVLALVAAAGSGSGDYKASPLSASAQWQVSPQTGDFGWSYPLRVPPPAAGPSPDLTITYASGGVDGRTSSTNNQTSWVGEGFDFWQGYIERKYKACLDDTADGSPKTGDLCWSHDNATMVLNGSATELILDDNTKTWHPKNDDGSKVEKLTDGDNGDNNGERWKLTTTDGTQYFFGTNKLPGWAANDPKTESTWTVPVFGNGSGEPCHDSTFASSSCPQAWRWNLDMVVDPHGNAMTYWYKKETNHYGLNMKEDVAGTEYDRGGYLERIDYGQRKSTIFSASAPAQVVFKVAERCEPGGTVTCGETELKDSTATYWRDVPYDLNCDANEKCTKRHSPSFWSRKRLIKVTTQILRPATDYCATSYCPVDSWALDQSYPATGDGSRSALWLNSIQHTGHRSGTLTLPKVTFTRVAMANRVFNPDGNDGVVPLYRNRIQSIVSETGGEVRVNYKATECSRPGSIPSSVDSNTMRCFPQHWAPDDEPDRLDWFHKYVVEQIVQNDLVAGGPQMVMDYQYVGSPAWHYDDDDGITPAKRKTWSQYRGYEKARIRIGATNGTRTLSEMTFFRGMDGDKQSGGAAPRNEVVRSSKGHEFADHWRLAGQPLETITYNGSEVVSRSINEPWLSARTAARVMDWGTSAAYLADTKTVHTYTALDGGRDERHGRVDREFDSHGLATQVTDHGEVGKSGDESCTQYTYARNTGLHMLTYVSRVQAFSKPCSTTPTLPDDFISHSKVFYDDPADVHGTAPVKGDVVKVEEVSGFTGSTPSFQTVMTREYDALGRETKTTNVDGKSVTTAYTQAPASGLLTSVTTTNAKLHETTTHIDPAWGVPQAEIDPNGKRTDVVYDALGRVAKVWLPGQTMGGEPHNSEFAYDIRNDGPSTVTTRTRKNDGTYAVSYELYDGLLRSRQTQLPAPGGGRVIADTLYDSRGLVSKKHANYVNSEPPGTTLFTPNGDEVPSATEFVYDGAARPVTETLLSRDNPLWHRSMEYGGDRVKITPPKGETPVMTVNDIAGRTTELHQYKGETPSGDADVTTYTYNPRGQLLTTTDPTTKNVWRNEYDVRGRMIKSHDPDKGTSELTYNALGQVVTSKDARGKTLAYTYDELGRKTGMFDGSASGTKLAEWTYDTLAKGQPTSSTRYFDGLAYTQRVDSYNDDYQPLKATTVIPTKDGLTKYSTGAGTLAGTHSISASYNFDGSLSGRLVPKAGDLAAEVFAYTYDSFGLPVRTKGSTTYVTNSVYSKSGQLLQQELTTGGPKTFRNFEYEDSTDRLKRAFTTRETQVSAPVSDVRYDYDAAGNVTSVADVPGDGSQADIQCYDYDYLRRLTNAWTAKTDCGTKPAAENAATTIGGAAPYWHTFSYDAVGNRKSEVQHGLGGAADTTRTYDNPPAGAAQPHSLTSVRTQTPPANGQPGIDKLDEYTYDAAGNTLTRKLNGNTQNLEWDAEGNLAQVTENGKPTSFVYDADGNRLLRKDPTGTTLYLGEQEILLKASDGTLKGTRYITHGGATVAVKTASGVQWLVSDHHGTAQIAINSTAAAGQGVQRRYQDPFGNPRGQQPTNWPGEKGFVGGTIDSSTGLTHLGAREYDPAIGRFISVDPLISVDDPQQMHGYAYSNNSPITFTDPDGLHSNPFLTKWAYDFFGPLAAILAYWWMVMFGNHQHGNGGGNGSTSPLNQQEQQQLDQARKVKKKSLTQVILETGGAVLLDVIGVTDIYNCVKGGVGACISAVAGAIPWYKIGKFAKAVVRAVKGVLSWIDQVKWADNVIKAAEDKIATAQAAAEQAAKKANDAPDAAGKKQWLDHSDEGGGALANGQKVTHGDTYTAIGDDAATAANARAVRKGTYPRASHDVIVHGSRRGMPIPGNSHPTHPAQIAEAIRSNPNYSGGPIRLLSCHSGNRRGWAQELADMLGVEVWAPTNRVRTVVRSGEAQIGGGGRWKRFLPAG